MAEEKLTPRNISRSEEAARYTLRKYGNRLPGIEHGFIIGLSIDKGKVEYAPEDVVRLP